MLHKRDRSSLYKTQGAWNSYDLDLSSYAGVVDLAHLKWIV
jgi:hypothetical protein